MNKFIRQINIVKNNDLETLENLLHDDFMFIRESGLVTRDEFVEHIKMLRTESGGLKFLDFKCCYEDENTLVWQDLFHDPKDNKRFIVTNFDAYKESKLWRTMINPLVVDSALEKIKKYIYLLSLFAFTLTRFGCCFGFAPSFVTSKIVVNVAMNIIIFYM